MSTARTFRSAIGGVPSLERRRRMTPTSPKHSVDVTLGGFTMRTAPRFTGCLAAAVALGAWTLLPALRAEAASQSLGAVALASDEV